MVHFCLVFLFILSPYFLYSEEAKSSKNDTELEEEKKKKDSSKKEEKEEEHDIADRQDQYEYNLYDRLENKRLQRQQYYYQESDPNSGQQYDRTRAREQTRANRSLYFNPNDE
jgi:hypothetical protein